MKYLIDFSRFNEHLADVSIEFVAKSDAPTLWLPTWIAGSYLIREFSKHITQVHYHTQSDSTLKDAKKLSKNTVELTDIKAGDSVVVSYEVYCYDLSVRMAYVDHARLFGNFTALLMIPTGDEQTLCDIQLSVPSTFYNQNPNAVLACGLKHQTHSHDTHTLYQLEPIQAFECYDFPFEISTQDVFDFVVQDNQGTPISHRFFITGKHHTNLNRLSQDVAKICQSYVRWLDDTPFHDYTFMTLATGSDYGGLEHINSTALVTPRSDLPTADEPALPSDDYQRFLGLCSHEYFHAWWVKTVRPDVMIGSQLQTEGYTPLLWVFEGFTSYIDDLMLLVSGVIDKPSYLKLLAAQINRYQQTEGRHLQSVADSSFDAWIKLYRLDENSTNQGISYYNKGALVALLLDLTLIKHSDGKYRLFDVIKTCYQLAKREPNRRLGLTTELLGDIISDLTDVDTWQDFYQNYIIGRTPLPIYAMLCDVGVSIDTKTEQRPWGLTVETQGLGLYIKHITRQSSASQAGLSAKDTIIAIDGIKASVDVLNATIARQKHQPQDITVHAFRRDELMTLTVSSSACYEHETVSLSQLNTSDKQYNWPI